MSGSSRKKLRKKERRLAQFGAVSYWQAQSRDQIGQVLEAFFTQKAHRMRELGLANAFTDPGVEDFITDAAHRQRTGTAEPVIELYAMSSGDVIIATFGGFSADGRFCGMFNSMAGAPYRSESPGELLLTNVIRLCCERGLTRFDLGVGDSSYKEVFCNNVEPLFDSVIPVTIAGSLVAPAWRAALIGRRHLKNSQAVMQARQIAGRVMRRAVVT